MSKISNKGIQEIKKILDDATSDPTTGVPGLFVSITNNKGDDLITYTSGYTGADATEKLSKDSIFWLASCTKLITTIAVLQLVEKGQLSLDDADQLDSILPELDSIQIATLNDDGNISLKPKKNRITLRMLLSHTAGFGYSFFNKTLKRWSELYGNFDFEINSDHYPVLFEPGTNWEYGVGIDWAGEALKRVTGQNLGDYFIENIFKPLGVKDASLTPNEELRKRIIHMNNRDNDTGKLTVGKQPLSKVIKGDYENFFHSGGAGLFSKPDEYVKILSTILNDGISPITGAQILKKETVESMFANQVPQFPNLGRKGIPDANPSLTNPIPDIYPQGDSPQGWGLSWFLTLEEGDTGRGKNTGFWCGLSNVFYWCDKEKGIAGMIASQILPFADANVLGSWFKVESATYANLE